MTAFIVVIFVVIFVIFVVAIRIVVTAIVIIILVVAVVATFNVFQIHLSFDASAIFFAKNFISFWRMHFEFDFTIFNVHITKTTKNKTNKKCRKNNAANEQ